MLWSQFHSNILEKLRPQCYMIACRDAMSWSDVKMTGLSTSAGGCGRISNSHNSYTSLVSICDHELVICMNFVVIELVVHMYLVLFHILWVVQLPEAFLHFADIFGLLYRSSDFRNIWLLWNLLMCGDWMNLSFIENSLILSQSRSLSLLF